MNFEEFSKNMGEYERAIAKLAWQQALKSDGRNSYGFKQAIHAKHPRLKHPLCGSVGYGSKNFLLGYDEHEITCQRCLKKLRIGKYEK